MSFDYSQPHADETEVRYDADALVAQLTAVQQLDAGMRREIGEVLMEYGREMVASADRLDVLQRFTLSRRQAA